MFQLMWVWPGGVAELTFRLLWGWSGGVLEHVGMAGRISGVDVPIIVVATVRSPAARVLHTAGMAGRSPGAGSGLPDVWVGGGNMQRSAFHAPRA